MSERTSTSTVNPNNQYEGTMDPSVAKDLSGPDSTIVTSDSSSTNPDSAAPQEKPQQQPTPAQQTGAPVQNPQAANGPVPGQKQPDLSKGPQQQPQAAPTTAPPNPAIKRANVFHDIAETLAGGPRYSYSVDEYGNMQKQKVPVSNAHLALAIAMEAIGGGITGLANGQGPNGAGRAAAAAYAKEEQQVQQQNQQQKQQAQADFARRAQVTEMNMRLYNNARAIGKMDEEANDKYIAQYADLAKRLQSEFPGYVHGPVKYSDFAKYNVTSDSAIPYIRVPRVGADGKQMTDSRGIPQWDINYLIVDPKLKATGLLSDKDRATLQEMGESWAGNSMLDSVPLSGIMALNQHSRIAQWQIAKQQFSNFADTVNDANGNKGIPNAAPTTSPELKGEANDLAEQAAKDNGVDARYVKALISHESGGNPNAVSSTGAKGYMQLTDSTAKTLGVNRDDPKQNVQGGTKLFKQLLDKYNNDPRLAFAAYYSGPGAVDANGTIVSTKAHSAADTQKYVDSVSKLVGLQEQGGGKGNKFSVPSMAEYTKTNPTFPADVEKFNGALQGTDGDYGKALAHMRATGQEDAANNISAFLGGADVIKQHDDYISSQAEERKKETAANVAQQAADTKKEHEEAGIIQRNQILIDAIANGKNIDLSRIATMRAYDREIIVNEILKRNPDYNPASIDRAIKLADEAADESRTGTIGNSIANVNTAYGHMGEAADSMRTLNNLEGRNFSDYTNRPMSWMDDHFGGNDDASRAYQQWKVSLQAAATDWQNLLNNQHALTDHDKKVAETVANPNATFGNAMAALQEMARTAAIRTLPLNQRWQQTMHTNYPNLIQPQTIDALKKINDPQTNNYLKDLESGGDLVNGPQGVGKAGQRVGDLLGNQQQKYTPPQGSLAGRDKQGNIVAWQLPNGQKVDANGQPLKQAQ